MGYATTLYAVDLDTLRAAVGSNDAGLIQRVWKLEKKLDRSEAPADEMNGPRIKVTKDLQIILSGRPVPLDQFAAALRRPEWKGTFAHIYYEDGVKPGPKKEQFGLAFGRIMVEARQHIRGINTCRDEEELRTGWQDHSLSEDDALRELVAGRFTRTDGAHQYGYALERLCRALGARLATIEGKARLRALKLDTPLSESRPPVPLPAYEDFPYISHLTAAEVQAEARRLGAMDLAYPKSAEIAEDRTALFKALKAAARKKASVVAFYH